MTRTRAGRSKVSRCPDCGQRLDEDPPIKCSLCGLEFGDSRSTSDDHTPYADAYSREEPGWWRMCAWVYGARAMRVKHLGLMRASMASRYFARVNVVLMSFALGVVALTEYGWRKNEAVSVSVVKADPSGAGWFRLAREASKATGSASPDFEFELWWNPARAIIATGFGVGLGWLFLTLLLHLMRSGVTLAHQRAYRHEQRMTAAINYGTAWFAPMLLAACVVGLRPLCFVGTVKGWAWAPADSSMLLVAGVLGGFGAAMWWFWLVRLGAAAPPSSRGAVTGFLSLGVPALSVVCILGWWHALRFVSTSLNGALNLDF